MYNFLVLFMNDGLVDFLDDLLVLLMDDRSVDLSNLFLVDDWLVSLMNDWLMVLMNNVLMMLMNHILMVLDHHLFGLTLDNGLSLVGLNPCWCSITRDYGFLSSLDNWGLFCSNNLGLLNSSIHELLFLQQCCI